MSPLAARSFVRHSTAAVWSRRVGALAVPILVLAALGHRTGAIPTEAIVPVLNVGFLCGLVAASLAIIAATDIWFSGANGFRNAVIGVIYASPALVLIGISATAVFLYPRLTDISTDLIDVPEFTLFLPAEKEAEEDRSLQTEAYPLVTARFYPVSTERAFAAVRSLVEDRGWTVDHVQAPAVPELPLPTEAPAEAESPAVAPPEPSAASEVEAAVEPPASGAAVVEATARTLLFAFPDHVVIRVVETGQGTRVDVRSASELGAHDLGTNARRIVGFLADLDGVLQGMEDAGPAEEAQPSGPAPAMPSPRPATP